MKRQKLDDVDGYITYITEPDCQTHVAIVNTPDFAKLEMDKTAIDYCTIVDGYVYISSKAKYDNVIVRVLPKELENKLK